MISEKEAKRELIEKYDQEAQALDTQTWLLKGGEILVPEPGAAHYFVKRKVTMALKLYGMKITDRSRALEIGCSFGQMTALLAKKFSHLTAVDISQKSVKIAEKRLRLYGMRHVNFTVDDAESLSTLPDGSFDVVFSFSTLRFCPQPEKALQAIREKLRTGGSAIIDFPNRHSPWHVLLKRLIGIKPHMHDRLYTTKEAAELFIRSGFSVDQVICFLFTSRQLPAVFLPLSMAVDLVLERLPFFSRFAGIIMVKGTK